MPIQLPHLAARCTRLTQLSEGLARETYLIAEGRDPLLYAERQAYLAALRKAIAGLEEARVTLARARYRIQGEIDAGKSLERPART